MRIKKGDCFVENLKCGTLSEFTLSKFTVIKNEDVEKYLALEDAKELKALIRRLYVSRKCNSAKKDNNYLVINTDESYAQEVIEIMKYHGHCSENNMKEHEDEEE